MFWGVNRGRRAKVASRRPMERKMPSAICSGFENPAIVRFLRAIRRRRGTRRSRSLAITFEREGKTATVAIAARAIQYSTNPALPNPAATQNQLPRVKYCALTGSDGSLGLIEMNLDSRRIGSGRNGCRGGMMLVANLDFSSRWCNRRCDGDPVHVVDGHCRAKQGVVATDDHALRGGLGRDNVERLASRDAESAALAYGEMMDTGVLTYNLAVGGDELALCL